MLRKLLPIFDCHGGEVLAEDVFNDAGVPIIVKSTVINQYIIEKLICLGVDKLKVYTSNSQNAEETETDEMAEFHEDYVKSVIQIKEVVNEITLGKRLNYFKINSVCSRITSKIKYTDNIIKYLSKIKKADEYTYNHSINVAFYSLLLAKWLKMSDGDMKNIVISGLLHDLGKIKVRPEILNKKGKLLPEEFEEIKKHSYNGYMMLKKNSDIPSEVCNAILMHHEREDGSGYPFGITGDHINEYAKIIAITDVYDAMTSNRVYKKAVSPFHAFKNFYSSGIELFDINMLMTFIQNISPYYLDSKVILDNGDIGEIIYIPPFNVTKPVIKLNDDYIDLSRNTGYQIQRIMGN